AEFAFHGARLWLGDINPAPLLLACLRSPQLIRHRSEIEAYVADLIRSVTKKERPRTEFTRAWLPDDVRDQLGEYFRRVEAIFDAFRFGEPLTDIDPVKLGALAIPVLAARGIVCYRSSDNAAWLKPGGLYQGDLAGALRRALQSWRTYAEARSQSANLA